MRRALGLVLVLAGCGSASPPVETPRVEEPLVLVPCTEALEPADAAPVWSSAGDGLVMLTVLHAPERGSLRPTLAAFSLDTIPVAEARADAESYRVEPSVLRGLVARGEHLLAVDLTLVVDTAPYVHVEPVHLHAERRVMVPAAGGCVAVRSGERGPVTAPLEEQLFVEIVAP